MTNEAEEKVGVCGYGFINMVQRGERICCVDWRDCQNWNYGYRKKAVEEHGGEGPEVLAEEAVSSDGLTRYLAVRKCGTDTPIKIKIDFLR